MGQNPFGGLNRTLPQGWPIKSPAYQILTIGPIAVTQLEL